MVKCSKLEKILIDALNNNGIEVLNNPEKIRELLSECPRQSKADVNAICAFLDEGLSIKLYSLINSTGKLSQFDINKLRDICISELWMSKEATDFVLYFFTNALCKSSVSSKYKISVDNCNKSKRDLKPKKNDRLQENVQGEPGSGEQNTGVACRFCGSILLIGRPYCWNCGRTTPYYVQPTTDISDAFPLQPNAPRTSRQTNKKERTLYFSKFHESDRVCFFVENTKIGYANNVDVAVDHIVPVNKTVNVMMQYGSFLQKRGHIAIPADEYDYFIFGGKPSSPVHKLFAMPLDPFKDYLNSIRNDIVSKLEKWLKDHYDDQCVLEVYYDHYELYYNDNDSVPADGEWHNVPRAVERIKYSGRTAQLMKKIPVKRNQWDAKGYQFCIKLIIYRVLRSDGYVFNDKGVFQKRK